MTALAILDELRAAGSSEKAAHLSRFFKTGPDEYGEGDRFLGVTVPVNRAIAKAHIETPIDEIQRLVESEWHEARLCGLLILCYRYKRRKTADSEREEIVRFYLRNARHCDNWDLVDLTCRDILGEYLVNRDRSILYRLAGSDCLWERRIAIVSTWAFIHRDDFIDTLALAEQLLGDSHDLMRKAVGWMLREVGKRDRATLTAFLEKHAADMPRTALRYAIEHYPEEERRYFMDMKYRRNG